MVFSGLATKPVATVFSGLALKPVVGFLVKPQNQDGGGFSGLGLKTGSYGFSYFGLKITTTVSWFGPQNQAGYGLSVAPRNRWEGDSMGHASGSSSLLHVKASRASIFQSGLKTGEGATAAGARGTIVEVALSPS
jgi:hypothetical protein